jgi:DNA polymerase-3 subunit alpha
MVNDYIDRKHGRIPIEYEFPELEPVLRDTYGTIVYQEQVIAISQLLCGMTAAQADLLRRAMGKKKPEDMAKAKAMFVEGAVARGLPRQAVETLYEKIALFAGYSFNRSHSAAYALLTYQTAYLKAHYPSEYMTAVLTSEQGHPDKLARYLTECRRLGIRLLPPDLNLSDPQFTHTPDGIRYGLSGIKHVGDSAVSAIIAARRDGPYTSLLDACRRLAGHGVNRRVFESLIRTGACDRFGQSRTTLLEQLPIFLKGSGPKATAKARTKAEALAQPIPSLLPSHTDTSHTPSFTTLSDEKQLLGVYLSGHPLDMHAQTIAAYNPVTSESLSEQRDNTSVWMAGVITAIRLSKTKKNDTMAFLTMEDTFGPYETVIFPSLYQDNRHHLTVGRTLILHGTLDISDHHTALKADSLIPLEDEAPENPASFRPDPDGDEDEDVCQAPTRFEPSLSSNHALEA